MTVSHRPGPAAARVVRRSTGSYAVAFYGLAGTVVLLGLSALVVRIPGDRPAVDYEGFRGVTRSSGLNSSDRREASRFTRSKRSPGAMK